LDLRGPTSKWTREGKGEREGVGGKRKGREKGGGERPVANSWLSH